MSESIQHKNLVLAIINWLQDNDGDIQECIIFHDTFSDLSNQKPPTIDNFIPDVYAISRDNKKLYLGEAKTLNDVESRHSRAQYVAYLNFCKQKSDASFVLAVPWTMVNCAKNLIKVIKNRNNMQHVKVIFLEKLPE